MAELVVYLAGEFLAETAISYFAVGTEATFLRAAIRAGSFVLTNKAAQSMGLYDSSASELKGQTINVRSSTAPRQLIYGQSLVGGVMFYAATTGSNNEYLHTVFGLADHQIQSVEKVYFGDEDVGTVSGNVSSGRYSGKARIQHKTTGGTAYADLVSETASLTNNWTSSHKLTGISSVYVRMQYDTSIFTSIPTVRALVKGKLVYDPRTTTTAWSDNPALCIRDYIMSDYGMRVTADEIDSASFIAAANICDETVTASGSVTQKRYTLNGVVDTSKSPREVLQDMLSTCAGMLIYSSGKYKLITGAFSSPVQTITVDDLRGDVQLSCANEKANLFNRVVGVFADADKLYSATEYPAIASATFKTQDGGEELTAQLDLNFTTNVLEAERLAKINLLKSRQGIVVNISCKPTCLNITAGDVVALTIAQLGWSGKYFRVMEWKLNEDIGVDLVLKEEDSTAYDWSTSDAIDGAPNTSLTLIQPQAAPTGLTATNQNISFPDGTILPAVHVTWNAVSSAYVTGYELQFKLSTDTVWQSIFTSQTVYDYAGQQQVALQYNIRVRAIFSDKEGPFSSSINHVLSGDTTAPSAPTSLTAVGSAKTIQLSWTNPTAADWFYNEIWENTTNNSSTATKIGEVSSSTFARSGLPASATRYYWLKAVDFSRNVSGFSTGANATTDASAAAGTDGINAITAYLKQLQSDPTPTFTTPTSGSAAPSGWSLTTPTATVGEVIWYIQGRYNSNAVTVDGIAANTTAWTGPVAANIFQDIKSDNWNGSNPPVFGSSGTYGTLGYYIKRNTGDAFFNNGLFRGTVESAASGNRVILNESSSSYLKVYDSSGGTIFSLLGVSGLYTNCTLAGASAVSALNVTNASGYNGTAITGTNNGTGHGVLGNTYDTGTTRNGVLGISAGTGAGAAAVYGANSSSFGVYSYGRFGVSDSTLVTNLNADYLDGNHASAFLTTSGTAFDSNSLGGYAASSWTRIFATNSGNANAGGSGINLLGSTSTGIAGAYVGTSGTSNIVTFTVQTTSPSDVRLKEEISDSDLGLSFVKQLRPVSYKLKNDPKHQKGYGFIADEVEQLIQLGSSLVYYEPDWKVGDETGFKTIHYPSYIAVLTKALQELTAKVESLEAQLKG